MLEETEVETLDELDDDPDTNAEELDRLDDEEVDTVTVVEELEITAAIAGGSKTSLSIGEYWSTASAVW